MRKIIVILTLILTMVLLSFNCNKKSPTETKNEEPIVEPETVTDIDGNTYKTVKIGNQLWMAENLKVTRYTNGDTIPRVDSGWDWQKLKSGGYCLWDNQSTSAIFGRVLYNWHAVNDSRNIAPEGWHVPSDEEWKELEMTLGMSSLQADSTGARGTNEGGKLKGFTLWLPPNTGATDEKGFSALPFGYRSASASVGSSKGYYDIRERAFFWTSTGGSSYARFRSLNYNSARISNSSFSINSGFSVRCIWDGS